MPVQTSTEPPAGSSRGAVPVWVAVVVGAVLVLAASIWVMDALTPEFVDELSIENPTDHPVKVQARGEEAEGWLTVATVPAGRTHRAGQILDQGQTWTFRFSRQEVAVERTYQRDELEGQGWQVTVPDELQERLRGEGVPAPEVTPFD